MKIDRYHIAALGFLIIFLYSLFILFTYRFKDIPDHLPTEIVKVVAQNSYEGMAIFTSSQFFDHLISRYPKLDIRAAGNKSWEQAEALHSFLLLTLDDNIDHFSDITGISIKELKKKDGITLYLFSQKKGIRTISLSSMIEKLKVSSSYHPKGSPFTLSRHKTGYRSWMYVGLISENFNKKTREGIWAHPLDKKGTFITVTTPPLPSAAKVTFQSGITDTGKCTRCAPVTATLVQGEQTKIINAPEGKWGEVPLPNFDAKKPITITIATKKPGRRHYCFNLSYTMETP